MPVTSLKNRTKRTTQQSPQPAQPDELLAGVPALLDDGFPNPRASKDIWEYQRRLQDHHWNEVITYLYRVEPKQMRIAGMPAYLEKFACAVSQDFIKQKYGGQVFKLIMNRRVNGKETCLFNAVFVIEAEPIVASGERLAPAEGAAPAAGGDQFQGLLASLVQDAFKQRDEAIKAGKDFDVSKFVASGLQIQQAGFLGAIEALKVQNQNGSGGALEQFMPLITPVLTVVVERLLNPPDPLETITRLEPLLDRLSGKTSGGAGAAGLEAWAGVAKAFVDQVPAILDGGVKVAAELRAVAAQNGRQFATIAPGSTQPAAEPQVIAPDRPAAATAPQPARFTPGTAATAAGAAAPSETPAENTRENTTENTRAQVHQIIVSMMLDNQPGEGCAYVVNQIDPSYALVFSEQLEKRPDTLAVLPVFAPVLRDPRLPAFAKAFVQWFKGEPETAPAAGAAAKPAA